jgi:hypothetical protein
MIKKEIKWWKVDKQAGRRKKMQKKDNEKGKGRESVEGSYRAPVNFLEGLRKNQEIRYPGPVSKWALPKFKSESIPLS